MSNAFDGKSGLVMSSSTPATETRETLAERHDRERFEHAKAEREATEAKRKEAVEAAMPLSMKANAQLQAQRAGINTGQALSEGQARTAQQAAAGSGAFSTAPQALVDQLPVTIGGIQLGPKQAQDMLARGEINRADYTAAVNKALEPYGYSSFR